MNTLAVAILLAAQLSDGVGVLSASGGGGGLTSAAADTAYANVTGDTMTGALISDTGASANATLAEDGITTNDAGSTTFSIVNSHASGVMTLGIESLSCSVCLATSSVASGGNAFEFVTGAMASGNLFVVDEAGTDRMSLDFSGRLLIRGATGTNAMSVGTSGQEYLGVNVSGTGPKVTTLNGSAGGFGTVGSATGVNAVFMSGANAAGEVAVTVGTYDAAGASTLLEVAADIDGTPAVAFRIEDDENMTQHVAGTTLAATDCDAAGELGRIAAYDNGAGLTSICGCEDDAGGIGWNSLSGVGTCP